ncbi:hypothetical protein KAR91_65030, partial [Candidatus Pacearchaeota archaeon]|nr:hypothetical protein [Candidatus Pacearchaeota archaeon]
FFWSIALGTSLAGLGVFVGLALTRPEKYECWVCGKMHRQTSGIRFCPKTLKNKTVRKKTK